MPWEMILALLNPFFSPDTGTGGGGGGNPDTGGTGGTQEPNPGGQAGGGTKVQWTPEQQAEIDRIIAERVSRANKTASKAALEARAKELGYESVEAMETALKAQKDAEEKGKSDLQKAQEALAAEKAKTQAAEERAKRSLIYAALREAAAVANFADPSDALTADVSRITVKEDGTVEGAKEAVEALAKAKPHYVKQGGSAGGGGGGGNPPRGGGAPDNDAERGRQVALQRNQQTQGPAGYNPWAPSGGGQNQAQDIAQAVATAVAAVLQGQGQSK